MPNNYKPAILILRNLDLSRQWYVEYQYRDPETGKFKRFRKTGSVNRIKKANYRIEKLTLIKDELNQKLSAGWNPFNNKYEKSLYNFKNLEGCIGFLLLDRKAKLNSSSYASAKSILLKFKRFCRLKGLLNKSPEELSLRHCHQYLDNLLLVENISKRTYNNHLNELRTCFNILQQREVVAQNNFNSIKKLKTRTKMHVPMSIEQLKVMVQYLKQHDQYFLMFCTHMMLTLRRTEILSLQIKDYDWKNNIISLPDYKSKNNKRREIRVHEYLVDFFNCVDWKSYPKDYYVFGPKDKPQALKHTNKDFYTKKFSKLRVEIGLSKEHTLYGLKHTLICFLAEQNLSIGELMKYGGFSSIQALEVYLSKYLQKPLDDLSDKFNILGFS